MKLSYEEKVKIYEEWKNKHLSPELLAREYGMNAETIRYFVHLADRWGEEKLKHTWTYYSPELKEAACKQALEGNESKFEISLRFGLSGKGTLSQWVKEYVANGYTVIEKPKGRRSHERQRERASGKDQGSADGERKTSPAERDHNDAIRISKKIKCLSYGAREPGTPEIAEAVTELRQETGRSVAFILKAMRSDPSLPRIGRSEYYYWLSHTDPDAVKYGDLMKKIQEIFDKNKQRYGYRRITAVLRREGYRVNHKTVKRLMKKMNLYGKTPQAKYKSYKGDLNGTVSNRLLAAAKDPSTGKIKYKRDFSTTGVNQKWSTDVSEFAVSVGKLYLSPLLDFHNREVVAYSITDHPVYSQVQDMLDQAFARYPHLEGLIFHSDQGWQYQMCSYHIALQKRGILQSMSRKGNCLDNSPMENFFGRMKNEMFYGHEREFKTLDQLRQAMIDYIGYYNNERIQIKLNGLTPCQARNQAISYC